MKQYTDQLLVDHKWITECIQSESRRQVEKWGIQKRTAFEWLAYLTEEVGELSKAISEHEYRGGEPQNVVNEAIQTATLAMKIAEMYLDGEVIWTYAQNA